LSPSAAATVEPKATTRDGAVKTPLSDELISTFQRTRAFTEALTADLASEDCVVQSMPDVSPAKWHLAHTTWFFETFVLKKWVRGYQPEVPEYAYLFNSYYNAAGDMHRRDLRGLISRPTVDETRRYRSSVNFHVASLIADANDDLLAKLEPLITLGVHHEQQHQELLITDIKHVFAQNPLHPVFRPRKTETKPARVLPVSFVKFDEQIIEVGHTGSGFSYDNETPPHRALVQAFAIGSRPVTNAEYLQFIEADGYKRSEFWLSLGWMTVNEQRWQAPLYWELRDGEWWNFTLSGMRRVDPSEPVTHISYFEADAYANWAGSRLPTEFELERIAKEQPLRGNFVEDEHFHPQPSSDQPNGLSQVFGDVWEWTRSSYAPYPGYRAQPGALGEYNGKFMCNQYVLRGGSCATSRSHIRPTYRNFFQPEKRWQFNGIRLAQDLR
jgi:ergothioneine biosynthesis protein EgtB